MVQAANQIEQPETAEQQLVPPKPEEVEQMKQVLLFLDSKDARGQALQIIQGYTGSAQNRQLFIGLELCKKILRLLGEDDVDAEVANAAFSILINLAQEQSYIEECIQLNVARRVFDFLMKNVRPDQS